MGAPSREVKFKQDAKPRSIYSGEDAIYGMGGLIRTQYVCTYIHTYTHTYIHIHKHIHVHIHIHIHIHYIHIHVNILYGLKGERAQDSNGKRGRFASYSGLRGPRSHEGQGAQVCQCQKRPNIEAKETYSGQRATVTYEDQGRMKVKKLRYASVSRSLLPL